MKNGENKESKYLEKKLESGVLTVYVKKPITINFGDKYDDEFDANKELSGVEKLILDCGDAKLYDSFLVVFIASLRKKCSARNIEFEVRGMNAKMESFVKTFSQRAESDDGEEKKGYWTSYFEDLGISVQHTLKDAYDFISFFGELIAKMALLVVRPMQTRWKDFPFHFSRAGVQAVPIVTMIVFLIGVISGYQGALQLAQFGADIFIADLVGISITRELSPLMTAILVAGRSGSAYAAEIGTMKVSEEVDALNSMGFDTIQFLALPRVLAVVLAMPILTLLADVTGIIGGLIAAISVLDVTISGYVNQLERALNYGHVFSGVIKSMVFGLLIAAVGCFRGLQVSGGVESVGKYTTASVVTGVFLIILADAVFTFLLQTIGI